MMEAVHISETSMYSMYTALYPRRLSYSVKQLVSCENEYTFGLQCSSVETSTRSIPGSKTEEVTGNRTKLYKEQLISKHVTKF
jgi:hypothetical protein